MKTIKKLLGAFVIVCSLGLLLTPDWVVGIVGIIIGWFAVFEK